MSWRKLSLYLFFLFIMALFYVHQQARIKRLKGKKEAAQHICHLQKEAVTQMELKNEFGNCRLRLTKGKWRLVSPISDWADTVEIDNMIDTVLKAKIQKEIKPIPKRLDPFGLESPRIQLTLKTPKKSFYLKLGSNTPNNMYVYALNGDGKAIYLLKASLIFTLNKKADDLRDKRLLLFDPAKVLKIEIRQAEKSIRLLKEGDIWQLQAPYSAKADGDEVDNLLFNFQTARIKHFDRLKFKPQVEIKIWQTNDKSPRWLKLALKGKELWGISSYHCQGFVLGKDLWDYVTRPADFYKDRHFIHFDKKEVAKVEISFHNRTLIAKRTDKGWSVVPKLAEDYEIDFLLDDLADLKYLPSKKPPPPFTSPQARVKLWDKKGKLILTLSYFEIKNQTWIKFNNKYYMVKNTVWDSFPSKLKQEGNHGPSNH